MCPTVFPRKGRLNTATETIPLHKTSRIAAFDNIPGILNWKRLSTNYNFQILFDEPYIGGELSQAFLISRY